MLSVSTMKKIGLFAGGVLFGTAGVKVLSRYIQTVQRLRFGQGTV